MQKERKRILPGIIRSLTGGFLSSPSSSSTYPKENKSQRFRIGLSLPSSPETKTKELNDNELHHVFVDKDLPPNKLCACSSVFG